MPKGKKEKKIGVFYYCNVTPWGSCGLATSNPVTSLKLVFIQTTPQTINSI